MTQASSLRSVDLETEKQSFSGGDAAILVISHRHSVPRHLAATVSPDLQHVVQHAVWKQVCTCFCTEDARITEPVPTAGGLHGTPAAGMQVGLRLGAWLGG